MTTKPPHRIEPMSHSHVRWAIRDMLRDPEGPLRGTRMPEGISSGRIDAGAVVELLSSCGIRRGAKEFFARILENADEDAEIVDGHIGGYGKGMNMAAKSLIRIIVVNSREENPDMEMEAALFACMDAAERMREKDEGLALAFLEFCGSAAFGSEQLKIISRHSSREEVLDAALRIMGAPKENTDAVMGEFFLAIRQISCETEEFEAEGMLRYLLEGSMSVAEKCPEALYSFLYYFCNASWEGIEEGLMYAGIFASPGVMRALSLMGKNHVRMAELADECFHVAREAIACAKDGCDGIMEALDCFSEAMGTLGSRWPMALVPFASYCRALLREKKPESLKRLAEIFTSEENLRALENLGDDPRMQMALMQACYLAATGAGAN